MIKKLEINIQKLLNDMEKEDNLIEGLNEFKRAIQNGQNQKSVDWYNPNKK